VSDLTSIWHAEHTQFSQLLNLFDAQLRTFREGDQPNYELMHDIVFYLNHYADRFHHPREDVAFERLIAREPALRAKVARLLQEHRVIAAHGAELLERLAQASGSEAIVPRETLESAAATYLVYYRHHLSTEEREILPRAQKLLSEADWAAVVAAVPVEGADPLFGEHPQERFRELRRQIAREAA